MEKETTNAVGGPPKNHFGDCLNPGRCPCGQAHAGIGRGEDPARKPEHFVVGIKRDASDVVLPPWFDLATKLAQCATRRVFSKLSLFEHSVEQKMMMELAEQLYKSDFKS